MNICQYVNSFTVNRVCLPHSVCESECCIYVLTIETESLKLNDSHCIVLLCALHDEQFIRVWKFVITKTLNRFCCYRCELCCRCKNFERKKRCARETETVKSSTWKGTNITSIVCLILIFAAAISLCWMPWSVSAHDHRIVLFCLISRCCFFVLFT